MPNVLSSSVQSQIDEEVRAAIEDARLRINKAIARRIVNAFEDDPAADFEKVAGDALASYRQRLAKSIAEGERRRAAGLTTAELVEKRRNYIPRISYDHEHASSPVKNISLRTPKLRLLFGSTGQAVESTKLKARLCELIENGKCLHSMPGSRTVVQLDCNTVVKFGPKIALEEFDTLEYVARHTSIPVPQPLGSMVIGDTTYAFTTLIAGDNLNSRWPSLTPDQKSSVQGQLDNMFAELRRVPYPTDTPLGTIGMPHVCKNMWRALWVSPPNLRSVSELHDFLVSRPFPRVAPSFLRWLRSQLRDDYRIVLTHGDLHPGNVVVADIPDSETVRVSGLVDWEMGGWYPEYWELYRAYNTRGNDDDSDWWELLPQAICGYDSEFLARLLVERCMASQ